MQELEAGAVAEPHPELAEAARRESVAGREAHVLVLQSAEDLADPRSVVRIALEVAPVRHDQPLVRRAVDVVDRPADRRQAAGDEGLAEALGRDRQVRHRGEATEALAEHAPAVHAELLTDVLGVAHDRIRPEVRQVRRPGLRACRPGSRDRPASTAPSRAGRATAPGSRRGRASSSRSVDSWVGSPRIPGRPGGTAGTGGRHRPARPPRG